MFSPQSNNGLLTPDSNPLAAQRAARVLSFPRSCRVPRAEYGFGCEEVRSPPLRCGVSPGSRTLTLPSLWFVFVVHASRLQQYV